MSRHACCIDDDVTRFYIACFFEDALNILDGHVCVVFSIIIKCAIHTRTKPPHTTTTTPPFLQTGEETYFKIKKTTKMEKVFATYAQRKGVQAQSLRFLLDGERINGDQTPKQLEIDDQDQIDCMLEQMGGGGR